jgi:hypothetical protein
LGTWNCKRRSPRALRLPWCAERGWISGVCSQRESGPLRLRTALEATAVAGGCRQANALHVQRDGQADEDLAHIRLRWCGGGRGHDGHLAQGGRWSAFFARTLRLLGLAHCSRRPGGLCVDASQQRSRGRHVPRERQRLGPGLLLKDAGRPACCAAVSIPRETCKKAQVILSLLGVRCRAVSSSPWDFVRTLQEANQCPPEAPVR